MSVTDYLDLAYAVIVDERVRRGASLVDVLSDSKEWAARSDLGETVEVIPRATPAGGNTYDSSPMERVDPGGPGAAVSREEMKNMEAMQAFMAQMGGLGGGSVK